MFARPLTLNVKGNVTRVPIRENSREPRIVVNRMDGQVKRGGVTGPVGFVQSPVFGGNCTDLLQLERLRFSDDDHGSIARKIGRFRTAFTTHTRARYPRSNFRFNRIVENTRLWTAAPSTTLSLSRFSRSLLSYRAHATSLYLSFFLSSTYPFIFLPILRASNQRNETQTRNDGKEKIMIRVTRAIRFGKEGAIKGNAEG